MSRDKELIRLSKLLATDTGGYPRYVAHNRAVSTAYYALFHAVAEMCAKELVAASQQPWPAFRHIYRSLDHGQAKSVFRALSGDADFGREAKDVANIFVNLQEERHGADYDPKYSLSQKELRTVLDSAERACDLVSGIPKSERKFLASRLIGRTRK
jgi:hypothetical protein